MAVYKVSNHAGKYYDPNSIYDVINYVTNPEKTHHHLFGGLAVSSDPTEAIHQMNLLRSIWNKEDCVKLRHTILSFEEEELSFRTENHLLIANYLGFRLAQFYSNTYQIFYAVHETGPFLHIHFVMNMLNYQTGNQYVGNKADLYHFVQYINHVLSEYGISATYQPDHLVGVE